MNYLPSTNKIPNYNSFNSTGDDRFFLGPFLVGGLAGTALGYGIANNNQINNRPPFYGPMMPYPYPISPGYPVYNTYYY